MSPKRLIAALAVLPLLVVGVACSSSDDSRSSTDAAVTSETAADTAPGDSSAEEPAGDADEAGDDASDSGADLDAANAILSEAEVRPTAITVTDHYTAALPPVDGTVYWVQCGVPACAVLGDYVEEAATAAGWGFSRISGGSTPESIKNAWVQAVNATPPPVAVIGSGYPRETFASELEQLEAMGIPAINISTNDVAGGGLVASLGSGEIRNVVVGKNQAAWTVVDGEGHPNTAFVYTPSYPSQPPLVQAFEDTYKDLCPSCEFTRFEVGIESIGTDLPQKVAAFLQQNPQVDHLAIGFGNMVNGLPTALDEAGMQGRVRIVTDTPDPVTATYMKDGQYVFAATAYPDREFAWQAIDVALRYNAGLDYDQSANAAPPQWVITPETLPSATETFPLVADYQEQFKALWQG